MIRSTRLFRTLIIVSLLGLAACSGDKAETQAPPPVKAVKYFTVGETSTGSIRRVTGVVEPTDKSELSFQVGGKVAKVLVKQGDLVSKDQVLAELDAKDYKTALTSAQAQLRQARAQMQKAQADYDRNQLLLNKKLVSQATVDDLATALKANRSQVTIAESQLSDATRKLARTKLTSPYAGIIASRTLESFQQIDPGKKVFEIQGDTGFEVKVPVPESMMPSLEYGQVVSASFPGLDNLELEAQVASIGSRVEAGSSFPVKVQLRGDTSNIRNGMTSNVTFSFARQGLKQNVYLIPIAALITSGNADIATDTAAVLVFQKDSSLLKKVTVKLSDIRRNKIEVLEGLTEGDIIVSAGVPFLHSGQKVTLWQPHWQER